MRESLDNTMKKIALFTSLAALAACSNSGDSLLSNFGRESGSVIDNGTFGAATLNNTQTMSGERQYTVDLAGRFANEVDSTVHFAFNSDRLSPAAVNTLRQQADWIRQFPEVRFRVYGHTDAVGGNAFNRRLGQRRANNVVRFFASQGIDRSRLEAVVSKGETQPLIATQNEEMRNRRTVTEVTGFVDKHPRVLDGKYAQIIYRDYIQSAESVPTVTATTIGSDG